MLDKLTAKMKLLTMNVQTDGLCPICNLAPKTRDHLFFERPFSSQCIEELRGWLKVKFQIRSITSMNVRRWKLPRFQKKLLTAALAHTVYMIWFSREMLSCVFNVRVYNISWGLNHQLKLLVELVP